MMNGAGGDDSRTGKDAGAGCKQWRQWPWLLWGGCVLRRWSLWRGWSCQMAQQAFFLSTFPGPPFVCL
jgi:hypothetical protein